ncbi:Blp family class II bacteriocin [Streptococcus cuniculipharyngis]|uniref:Bacteriocin n=1 Tax=Streptococcus cuniculipharyngis TaxID=1562651 RepID=A0A5C5SFM5_9STRE|nr:Blp family class II bacteriocin [Streptococcus cuniculipharyngis]TWS98805.1 bacteriocin [Streptococcus cuniculipharyngis]
MNTKAMAQFEVLNIEHLANIEGGGCNRIDGGKAVLAGGISSATVGFFTGGPLGAIGGAAGYYGTCWIG